MLERPNLKKWFPVGAGLVLAAYGLIKLGDYIDHKNQIENGGTEVAAVTPPPQVPTSMEEQVKSEDQNGVHKEVSAGEKFQVETPPHTPQSQFGKIGSLPEGGSSVPPTPPSGRDNYQTPVAEVSRGNCTTLTFHHAPLSSHADGEACANHNNLFVIQNWGINTHSVCVRVNGKPVKYKFASDPNKKIHGVLLGSVAGPRSKVTVSYCSRETQCAEDCTVVQDPFMSAIGGEVDSFQDQAKLAAWDGAGAPSKVQVQLAKELKGLEAELEGTKGADGKTKPIFRDWVRDSAVASCVDSKKPAGQ